MRECDPTLEETMRAIRVAVLVLLCLRPLAAQNSTAIVFPGEHWEYVQRSALTEHGWSPEALQKTTAYIRDDSNTTGLVVVDRGRVVYQYGDITELSYV